MAEEPLHQGPVTPSRGAGAAGVALSLAALAAASLAAIAYSANAPLIRETFALTEVEVGGIASCIYAGAAVSSVVSGRLTDSLGPGRVLAIGMILLALGCAVSAVAPGAGVFFGGLAIVGLGYGSVNPPSNVLSNPKSARWRGLSMSVKQSGIPFGGLIAGIVVPALATGYGWRGSMLVPVFTCGVLALVSAAARLGSPARDEQDTPHGLGVLLRLPRAFAFGFLLAGVQVAIFVFLALYVVDDRGMSASRAGSALALLLLGGLVGRPTWGWLSDRLYHDRVRVLQVSALLAATFLFALPYVSDGALPIFVLCIGLCSVGWNGVYLASISEAIGPGLVGSTTGRALLLVNIGAVLIPPAIGFLAARTGSWSIPWAACGALSLTGAAILQGSRVEAAITSVVAGGSDAL